MSRHLINFLIISLLSIPVVANAQRSQKAEVKAVSSNQETVPYDLYKKVEKEREDLKKELEDLKKKIDSDNTKSNEAKEREKVLKNEIDSLKKVNRNLAKSQGEAEKAKGLKQEVDSLKKVIAGMQADRQQLVDGKTAEMQQVIDSLNRELVAVRQTQDLATSENTQQKQTIEQLDKELQELEVFKREYIDNLAEVYNRNWASKLFSQIDGDELAAVIADCKRYAAQDKRVAVALANLNELNEHFMVYEAGKKSLVSRYNREDVANIGTKIASLKTKTAPVRKQEMDDLFDQLKSYKGSVSAFKLLINNIDEAAKDFDTHATAWPMIEIALEDDENSKYIRSIELIPWLKGQYEIYMKQLEKDCKAKNEVHDLILGLSII